MKPSALRALDVWMNGEHVGQWRVARGEHALEYSQAWLASPNRRPLSLSMPLRPSSAPYGTRVVLPFFDNLLPDSDRIRSRLAARFGAASAAPFDLLEQLGRDCVGAIQLMPPGHPPVGVQRIRGRRLTDGQVAEVLASVVAPGVGRGLGEEFRISLAGAQEKTALLERADGWARPEGATPTTHIFKLPIFPAGADAIDLTTSVENEWLCAQLLPQFGIACASCQMATFKNQRALIVERFDRRLSDNGKWIIRLPQEDLCQATATPVSQKYESEGGPGIERVMKLLLGSSQALKDREDFFRTQFLFWLLCAIDGHAKNFSVFLEVDGAFRLTPRYDVLSAYPVLGPKQNQLSPHKVKMAMAVWGKNRRYHWKEIQLRHWLQTGRDCGLPGGGSAILEGVLQQVPTAIAQVRARLPKGFPTSVSRPIFEGLQSKATDARRQLGK